MQGGCGVFTFFITPCFCLILLQIIDSARLSDGPFFANSLIGGIALLFKVWWNLSFNYTSHLNAAGYVALVMTCAVLIWIGMTLTASAFGVLITQG